MSGSLFFQHLHSGMRSLRRSPGVSLTAIVLLALGIGLTTALFSIVNTVLLNRFPYRDPDHLVIVWEKNPTLAMIGDRVPTAYKNFAEWQSRTGDTFESIAGLEDASLNLTGGDHPDRLAGARVSPNFFSVLGVSAAKGSTFDALGADAMNVRAVILSNSLYQSRFGGDPKILGRTLTLNDIAYTVIGVLPRNFYLPSTREGVEQRKPDLWIAYNNAELAANQSEYVRRKIQVYARLRPGVTLEQARARMDVLAKQLETQDPKMNAGFGMNVFPLSVEDVGKDMRRDLLILLAAVGLVLLIACTNIANLLLSRAAAREKEMAIRKALGASPGRLITQLLTEDLVLSVAGAALGWGLAYAGLQALIASQTTALRRPETLHLGWRVFLFSTVVSLLTTVLFGLAPALQLSRVDSNTHLKQSGDGKSTAARHRMRAALIVGEVGLAVVLLIGAGLMLRSLFSVLQVDPGFKPDHLLTMRFSLPQSRYSNPDQIAAFCRNALDRIRTVPGINAASFSDGLPLTRLRMMKFVVEGRELPKAGSEPTADMRGIATPDYFNVLQLPIVAGRNFTAAEIDQKAPVIVINQALARKLWPKEDPLGKHLRSTNQKPGAEPLWLTVIGVAGDAHQVSLESGARPEITRPMVDYTNLTLALRTSQEPQAAITAIQAQIWQLDKDLPVYDVETMEQILEENSGERRFNSFLMTTFAVLSLLLAAVGIYGVLSSMVGQRTREMGIRLALGAQKKHLFAVVVGQGMKLVGIGLAIGLIMSLALSRAIASLLYAVSSLDVLTYAAVAAGIGLIALLACYLPAYRATAVHPMEALRHE